MTPAAAWLLLASASGALPLPPPWPLPLPPLDPAPLADPPQAPVLGSAADRRALELAPGVRLAPGVPEEPRRPGASDGPATRDPNSTLRDLLLEATPGITLQFAF
ncbi:MAG: hypothetical protein NZM07_02435 [Elioraea sp.]|nr:hypothetical protein [Elioraea sp.]